MKPIFSDFTSTENEKLSINLVNVVSVRLDTKDDIQIICVGDIVFRVRGNFEAIKAQIKTAIEAA